jgi:two-component system, NarL family, response regulator DesR
MSPPAGDASQARAPDRESPADHGAFVSHMALGNVKSKLKSRVKSEVLPVALCAEERSFRDQLSAALTAGGHAVLARSTTGEGLLASCNGKLPACVVIAADRPDRATLEIVRLVRSQLGGVRAVLVCRHAVVADVRRALELGIDGVVLQEDAQEALAAVVAAVCAGQVSAPNGQRRAVRARALTTREKQILTLMVTGQTNSQIASELFLAESTVKSHLSSAFGKLGVSSRSEAAAVILDPERGHGLGIGNVQADFVARA